MESYTPPSPFQTFSIAPQLLSRGKTSTRLVRTEHINSGVQVVAEGGETNLHAHSSQDEIWFVLSGAATFYTEGNAIVAKLAKHQENLVEMIGRGIVGIDKQGDVGFLFSKSIRHAHPFIRFSHERSLARRRAMATSRRTACLSLNRG